MSDTQTRPQMSVEMVEGIAPDTASLKAAQKLTTPAKWSFLVVGGGVLSKRKVAAPSPEISSATANTAAKQKVALLLDFAPKKSGFC